MTEVGASAAADLMSRGAQAWEMQAQVRRVGGCEQPIRLRGRVDLVDVVTGEARQAWSSQDLPDGTVLVACGNRRVSRCAPCSRLYQGDAFQVVAAGLAGGKGVPADVGSHPALFVTLTAPSFGPVHTTHTDRHGDPAACTPRADAGVCDHGLPLACWARHDTEDPQVGRPVCGDCFDYEAAVLWHAHAGELWRRTRIDLYRQLAKLTGQTEKAVKAAVRIEYVKVAEYQRRGLLHYHLVLRLDGAHEPFAPPPDRYTIELLAAAVRAATAHVEVPYPTVSPSVDPVQLQMLTEGDVGAGQGLASAGSHVVTLDARPAPEGGSSGRDRGPYPARPLPVLRLHDRPGLRSARWGAQLDLRPLPVQEDAAGEVMDRGRSPVTWRSTRPSTPKRSAGSTAASRRPTCRPCWSTAMCSGS